MNIANPTVVADAAFATNVDIMKAKLSCSKHHRFECKGGHLAKSMLCKYDKNKENVQTKSIHEMSS